MSAAFFKVEMIEKLDCILSKRATRPYIYEYKCECVRTHLCIDPAECLQPDSNLRSYETHLRPYETHLRPYKG